jgi:hypothetical protein
VARSVYFSQAVKSEQNLYEDLVIESLKIYGQDVYYMPRTMVSRDFVLGEDRASKFNDAYMIEAYIESSDGFEGAGDLYSKFGLEIRDEATFVISRRQWEKYIGFWNTADIVSPKPLEGDILFLPMTNKFFEITFVEHEQPFYQLSNLPVYKLQCSLYEYNDEDFETGIESIDVAQVTSSYQVTLDYNCTANEHPEASEIITQILTTSPNTSVFGEIQTITKLSPTTGRLGVSNIGVSGIAEARDFVVSSTLTAVGGTSANTITITKVYDIGDNSIYVDPTDDQSGNLTFEVEADGFLDFTESNPFGDASENY